MLGSTEARHGLAGDVGVPVVVDQLFQRRDLSQLRRGRRGTGSGSLSYLPAHTSVHGASPGRGAGIKYKVSSAYREEGDARQPHGVVAENALLEAVRAA